MNVRKLSLSALVAAVALVASAQQQQQQPPRYERQKGPPLPVEPLERFRGPLPATRNRALAGATVVLRHWHIPNDQRIEIPHEGFLVVHLHSGEVTVISGGRPGKRQGDEFWTVAAGERLVVETERDSVVLRTLDTVAR